MSEAARTTLADEAPIDSARRRTRRLALGALATLFLAIFAGLAWQVFFTSPRLPQTAVHAQRDADGRFPADPPAADGITGRIAATEARKSTSSFSTTSSSSHARLRSRSAAVIVNSPELIAQRVGFELFKELKKSSRFESLAFYPPGQAMPSGEPLPDVYIQVGVKSLKESGLAPYKSLETTIEVEMGDQPRRSSHSYNDHLTPPRLHYHWGSTTEYSGRIVGVETSAARYEGVATDLAGDLKKAIEKFLGDLAQKHGQFRVDATEFFPAESADYEPKILKELNAERVVSGHGFMLKKQSVWKAMLPPDRKDVPELVAKSLEADGWGNTGNDLNVEEGHLHATTAGGAKVFEVFKPNTYRPAEASDDAPREWYFVYTERLTTEEITTGVKALFARNADEDELAPFAQWWPQANDEVSAYFAAHPPRRSASIEYLVRRKIAENDLDAAKKLLLRGDALRRIAERSSSSNDELKKLAKKVGLEELPKIPDLTALEPDDLIDAEKDLPKTVAVGLDEPAILFIGQNEGELRFVSVTPTRRTTGDGPPLVFRTVNLTLGEGSSSWGDSTLGDAVAETTSLDLPTTNGRSIMVRSRRTPDLKKWELRFE